jgi:hypothetical protein
VKPCVLPVQNENALRPKTQVLCDVAPPTCAHAANPKSSLLISCKCTKHRQSKCKRLQMEPEYRLHDSGHIPNSEVAFLVDFPGPRGTATSSVATFSAERTLSHEDTCFHRRPARTQRVPNKARNLLSLFLQTDVQPTPSSVHGQSLLQQPLTTFRWGDSLPGKLPQNFNNFVETVWF